MWPRLVIFGKLVTAAGIASGTKEAISKDIIGYRGICIGCAATVGGLTLLHQLCTWEFHTRKIWFPERAKVRTNPSKAAWIWSF